MTRALGIDMSGTERSVGLCLLEFDDNGVHSLDVNELGSAEGGSHRISLGQRVRQADDAGIPVGIDAPFGWPVGFRALMGGEVLAEELWNSMDADRLHLRFRVTDLVVRSLKRTTRAAIESTAALRKAGMPISPENGIKLASNIEPKNVFEMAAAAVPST